MSELETIENKTSSVWRFGLVGGVVAIALTLGQNWPLGSGGFSANLVVVGGLLAGYLAERNESKPSRAGIVAGVVGIVPGGVFLLFAASRTFAVWIAEEALVTVLIAVPTMLLFIVGVGALVGAIGGGIGGWIATRLHERRSLEEPAG
ncbi:hypothetical protein AUR64_16200 [Haloprofundus marisrubri]|uniref:DUF5518 domain-containing protein n=1 Tax=Haloprofundus marisrubri TaxID=1514971 RepID=A0A0W1R7E1_9EURY|nr:DUF5518 domain-containing protein [Haloprofundus marisrubri]KTG09322.1 hypothetical protein AUR64_16200 [Haloprofundus marisrubri]